VNDCLPLRPKESSRVPREGGNVSHSKLGGGGKKPPIRNGEEAGKEWSDSRGMAPSNLKAKQGGTREREKRNNVERRANRQKGKRRKDLQGASLSRTSICLPFFARKENKLERERAQESERKKLPGEKKGRSFHRGAKLLNL